MAETRHITFSVGEHRFAVSIHKVREILSAATVLSIPGGRDPLEGVIPYRNETVLPVFSLLGLLGGQGKETNDLIVVVGTEGSPVGFRMSGIGGVLLTSGAEEEVSPYEGDLKAPEGVISGVLKKSGGDHILLDVDRLFGT